MREQPVQFVKGRSWKRLQQVDELDELLLESRTKILDRVAFRDRTGELLGPPRLTQKAVAEYRSLCDGLLAPACAAMKEGEFVAWQRLQRHWQI
jgi:hypothetical protein